MKNKVKNEPQVADVTELDKRLDGIRRHMQDAAVGPLRAAPEVMRLAAEWSDKYKAKCAGQAFESYLRSQLGRGVNLRFFRERSLAAQKFGASLLHHSAAVWLGGKGLPELEERKLLTKVGEEFRRQGRNPLGLAQLRRVWEETLGPVPVRPRPQVPPPTPVEVQLQAELTAAREEIARLKAEPAAKLRSV